MKPDKSIKISITLTIVLALALSIVISSNTIVKAGDDDVPFFVGATGLPNVLFIFDNSDSMQDLPYLRKDGSTVRPNWWRWRRGVKVDADGTIAEDANGHIIYDDYKYVSTDNELSLPGKTPPPLPGGGSLNSTVTRIETSHPDRIYDSNIDWSDSTIHDDSNFRTNYRYCVVKITDANGASQYRTIINRSNGGKYFVVDQDIDYSGTSPYTYEITTNSPGNVTYNNASHLERVYDANFDWSTITSSSVFNNTYRYKLLVITAGPNAGETRGITGYSTGSKYWRLSSPLPNPCDYTTRYKIVGSNDDNLKASGGNHPASKLYQAKKALNEFLDSSAIKVCVEHDASGNCTKYKYLLNFGFATYMSARIPRVTAKYYRKYTFDTPPRCRAYYWRWRDTYSDFYDPDGPTNGYDIDAWGTHYEDVQIGDHIDRLYYEGHCEEQTIHYTVTEISPSPTDSLPNRYRIRLRSRVGVAGEGGYKYYHWVYFAVGDCNECSGYAYPDPYNDGTYIWHRAPECDAEHVPGCVEGGSGWYYQTTFHDTYGDYEVSDPDDPRYIDPVTGMVTPEKGHCSIPGDDWLCTSPDPDAGEWTLVESTISGVPINSSGDIGDIEPLIYDSSFFRYPGRGDENHPHGWSYRRAYYNGDPDKKWIYRRGYWSGEAQWGDDIQPENLFPAEVGDEGANHSGDDQVIFVNLPAYDDGDEFKGDDVYGNNITKIKNYVSLARVPHPRYSSLLMTMMPYTNSLAVNSGQAVAGKGTPLAATLEAAKKYYESYLAQDGFTQGGCRDNYIILLTDGLETCDGDPVQAAADLLTLTAGDEPAPVKTYVIGFGLDDASKEKLNEIAAAGGTGHAYFANNVEDLVDILVEDITSEIISASYTRSAPVITSVTDPGDELRIYSAYFDYPTWRGHLKAFKLEIDEQQKPHFTPVWLGDCTGDGTPDGDAGCEMKIHGRGTVYTTVDSGISPSRIEFSTANVGVLKPYINPDGLDIDGNGTANETADAEAIINYVLDPGYDNSKYLGTRDPDWPLGDIYHSVPVVVTAPRFSVTLSGYSQYKTLYAGRETVIYVGANDGMVHAFKASDGQELWAYIPKCVLSKLHEFSDGHRFTVDLPMKAADIYSEGGSGTPWPAVTPGQEQMGWHTVLVSGLRQGGYSYFAIDVTDPNDPKPMWELTDNNMGKTWSTPNFGRININGTNKYVLFIGGGISADENKGNRVYIVDVATGTILKEIVVGSSTNNVPSELLVVRSHSSQNIEAVYFGDTNGTLWKLTNLNADSGWNPTLEELFTPDPTINFTDGGQPVSPRPIFHRPAVYDLDSCGKRLILFGTGDEQNPTEDDTFDYFFEIEDRSLQSGETPANRMKWVEDFPQGEKLLSDPVAYLGIVYFTTYQPQGGCDMGKSYFYGLTISKCVKLGGDAGLQYDENDNKLNQPIKKIYLGKSIATSVTIGPPRAYLQKPGGGQEGLGPPVSLRVPTRAKLIYWKEEF